MSNIFDSRLNLEDQNLVMDGRLKMVLKELIEANLKKNEALTIYDQKLQFVASFLMSMCNDKTAEARVRNNARQAMEYLGIRVKNPLQEGKNDDN